MPKKKKAKKIKKVKKTKKTKLSNKIKPVLKPIDKKVLFLDRMKSRR